MKYNDVFGGMVMHGDMKRCLSSNSQSRIDCGTCETTLGGQTLGSSGAEQGVKRSETYKRRQTTEGFKSNQKKMFLCVQCLSKALLLKNK